jgi:hypothetical protein
MKAMAFVVAACLIFLSAARAATPELKVISCMFELQAEAYRFLRLEQQILQAAGNAALVSKLKSQIKASAQEMSLNVSESRTGLNNAGMQNQHKLLEGIVADYIADGLSSTDNQDMASLRYKQNALIRLAAEYAQQLEQKLGNPATRKVAMIGRAKVNVERFSHDFEMCRLHCEQVLNGELADLDRSLDEIRSAMGAHFSQHAYEQAKNQMVFMRLSVERRAKAASLDAAQNNLIVAGGHLWGLIDAVLDSYTRAGVE